MPPEGLWQPYREEAEADLGVCASCRTRIRWRRRREELGSLLRYLAIRVQKKQGELFADGKSVQVLRGGDQPLGPWTSKRLLEWQREKAGTIESGA